MKLIIYKNQLNEPPEMFLRRAGYANIYDRRSGQESCVRRLSGGFYPRLHIYIEEKNEQIIFNLHLDQKQPSYAGAYAHNADYDGEVVEEEIERIKSFLISKAVSINQNKEEGELLEKIGESRDYNKSIKFEKKSWWKFWQ